jgi:hypothetical protein
VNSVRSPAVLAFDLDSKLLDIGKADLALAIENAAGIECGSKHLISFARLTARENPL